MTAVFPNQKAGVARPVSESILVVPPNRVHYALVIHHTLPLPKVLVEVQDVGIHEDVEDVHVAIARDVVVQVSSW